MKPSECPVIKIVITNMQNHQKFTVSDGTDVALYIQRVEELKTFFKQGHYSRVYFGVEFCESMFPSCREIQDVAEFCRDHDIGFTLVTPYVSDKGIHKLEPVFEMLGREMAGCEIVINDFGVLQMLEESRKPFTRILGRILARQKKDPRINLVRDSGMRNYFAKNVCDNISYCEFLTAQCIERIELDNPLQGTETGNGFRFSMYFPYVYLTTAGNCFVDTCAECVNYVFALKNGAMGRNILLKGKTQFYRNEDLSAFHHGKFDRLIHQVYPPY